MRYCKNCEQMVGPQKDFSLIIFIILFILGFLPGIIYLIYSILKKETCPICNSTNWGTRPSESDSD